MKTATFAQVFFASVRKKVGADRDDNYEKKVDVMTMTMFPSGLLWLMETMDMSDLDSCLQTFLITPHTSLPQIPDDNDDPYLMFVDFGALPHYLALKCA